MHDVATQGRTVLFVSHNMGAVLNLCERVLLLGGGCILRDGTASSSIQEHLESTADNLTMFWNRSGDLPSTSLEIRTARAELLGSQPNHKLLLEINCTSLSQHKSGIIVLDVLDLNETAIMQIIPSETPFMEYQHGVHSLKIEVLLPPLIPGRYRIAAWIGSNHDSRLDQVPSLLAFEITAFPDPNRTFPYVRSHGSIIAPSKFSYEKTQPQLQNK